jgi:ribonuclease HI
MKAATDYTALCISKHITIGTIGIGISTFYQTVKLQLKHLVNTRSLQNWFGTATNPLIQLAEHNTVQLIWVPGHEGIDGNETADQLARKGSENPFI